MPEEKNHFVALHVQRRIIQSLLHDISTYTRPRVVNSTIVRPMFTVKHANDTEEFYETIKELELQQISRACAYRYQSINAQILATALRSRPNLLPQAAPAASVGGTGPSPSPPHAADAP